MDFPKDIHEDSCLAWYELGVLKQGFCWWFALCENQGALAIGRDFLLRLSDAICFLWSTRQIGLGQAAWGKASQGEECPCPNVCYKFWLQERNGEVAKQLSPTQAHRVLLQGLLFRSVLQHFGPHRTWMVPCRCNK